MSVLIFLSFTELTDLILMIEDDTVVREADQLDLLQEEDEVLLSPDQQGLLLPLPPDVFLQDPEPSIG